ncbi:PD-(D/E)XK nuclease family protein [Campylobacter pinnipediorum]|uniref:PDDEXK-like family protein n=1 Tax=Campylobacter pinnipediorum TaxID=1965231 RepID=UPI00084D8A7F|nr:PD-(D/E)XK nuclease family protein [Campylobacter pinnipediorum]
MPESIDIKDGFVKELAGLMKKSEEEFNRQKMLGKHDYNIFTLFHDYHNEVNLHSNFIHSILNTKGSHYKDDLFLKLFIDVCGLQDFRLDTKNAIVQREHENIDIYINDGNKHIIIENKIYAKDQDNQIERYIDEIINSDSNDKVPLENICVIYLTLTSDRELIEQSSGKYTNKLGEQITYRHINYKEHISEWIKECKEQVENIADMSMIFTHYEKVLQMLDNKYITLQEKGISMELEKLFVNNYDDITKIYENYHETRKKVIAEFVEKVFNQLKTDANFAYEAYSNVKQDYSKGFSNLISIKLSENISFVIESQSINCMNFYAGFYTDNKSIFEKYKDKIQLEIFNEKTKKYNKWIVYTNNLDSKEDFCKYILDGVSDYNYESKLNEKAESFAKEIIKAINKFQEQVKAIEAK